MAYLYDVIMTSLQGVIKSGPMKGLGIFYQIFICILYLSW